MPKKHRTLSPEFIAEVRGYLMPRQAGHRSRQCCRASGMPASRSSRVRTRSRNSRPGATELSDEQDFHELHSFLTVHEVGMFLRGAKREASLSHGNAKPDGGRRPVEVPSQMMLRIRQAGPPVLENLTGKIELATIVIEGSQWGPGNVWLDVTIACADWHGYAVQRGRIGIKPNPGKASCGDAYWNAPREYLTQGYGRKGKVTVTLGCCTDYNPFWDVAGVDMPIGKFSTGPEFAWLNGLSPGDQVSAAFGTWLSDVQQSGSLLVAGDAQDALLTDGLAPVKLALDETAVDDPKGYKRRLISIIRATGLDVAPDGYVELSRCAIRVEEA